MVHHATFVGDPNPPNGGDGPPNLIGPLGILGQPFRGIGFILVPSKRPNRKALNYLEYVKGVYLNAHV
jgi:hypothetical protein